MIRIIGIDGLDKNIIDRHLDMLTNFRKISDAGILRPVESVFPADSVPAWTTIFTGLNPAEHGIIRGKDYIESVEDFGSSHGFILKGRTFWDYFSARDLKCLVINPFLAYPAWDINGIMESGPAFIEGSYSIFPKDAESLHPEVLGGYSAISNLAGLRTEIEKVFDDTARLWEEYEYQAARGEYDLEFVTFTTLDRLQHYTWRYYDQNDPLYEKDEYFSECIPRLLKDLDEKIGMLIAKMNDEDSLVLISDHGFRQRPHKLVNLNEFLRKKGLLVLKKEYDNASARNTQVLKKKVISLLSRLKLLDKVASRIKGIKGVGKLKKSDHLIDKENSLCYTDDLFSGKKPYVGLNFGNKIRKADKEKKENVFMDISSALLSGEIPQPVWIKRSTDLYSGEFTSRLPDICLEFQPEIGIEFNYFGEIFETSSTHYRISGGHFGSGTFGFLGKRDIPEPPESIIGFSGFIRTLNDE